MNIDAGVIFTAVATVWAFITTGFVWVYKGRIADLRETITHERNANRAMTERLFTSHVASVEKALNMNPPGDTGRPT